MEIFICLSFCLFCCVGGLLLLLFGWFCFYIFFLIQKQSLVNGRQIFSKTVFFYSSSKESDSYFQILQISFFSRKFQCSTVLLSVAWLSQIWTWSNHMIHCNSSYKQFKTLGSHASKLGMESGKSLLNIFRSQTSYVTP